MVETGSTPVEIWGGVECSVNRIADRYHDQLELNGHADRLEDLDRIASLGIRTLRYPCLWEHVARGPDLGTADWSACDARLARIAELGIEPIAGLVHHGSGPRHTGLLDPAFPRGLAEYAVAFARRYPRVSLYTPVNEPLTTARFSALYGLWYPHARSDGEFVRALLNECRATVLAMQAVRLVNPEARLVQTEDFGRIYSTPKLRYQADFENERRWLTWDLLCGRVDRGHALWRYLRRSGIRPDELDWFQRNPCPPDVIGINHYVTSNRYLDHRIERYPREHLGGNGRDVYADVEAVRILPDTASTWADLIDESWQRYRIPIAVTEVHLGCTRDEQMRWLFQAWNAATIARARGCDVRAITPWALFGSHDWASLLTRFDGAYEPGAWDVRSREPRRTALAGLIEDLVRGRPQAQPSWLHLPGWWQRETRLLHSPATSGDATTTTGPVRAATTTHRARELSRDSDVRPILITGATGTLGRAIAWACEQRGLPHCLVTRSDMDIAEAAAVDGMLQRARPIAVINAAGYVRVDDAEVERDRCERENFTGPAVLASACAARGLPLVTFSSDLVFDGLAGRPYVEADATCPICVYGEVKARAEHIVLQRHPGALVVRTSAFFGPWDDYNFLTVTLRALARGESVRAPVDLIVSPTYVPDLVHATLDLLLDRETGMWHLANRGSTSWHELARTAALRSGVPVENLVAVPSRELGWRARRPPESSLASTRGAIMPTLEAAVERYLRDSCVPESMRAAESSKAA